MCSVCGMMCSLKWTYNNLSWEQLLLKSHSTLHGYSTFRPRHVFIRLDRIYARSRQLLSLFQLLSHVNCSVLFQLLSHVTVAQSRYSCFVVLQLLIQVAAAQSCCSCSVMLQLFSHVKTVQSCYSYSIMLRLLNHVKAAQ